MGTDILQLITQYAKTWWVLRAYDEDVLVLPTQGRKTLRVLGYDVSIEAIVALRDQLDETPLFGNEYSQGLSSILGNIEQTFDGNPLYETREERAAHLLYFIIKDHPFSDGNKRIGCLLFLLYLSLQGIQTPFNENGLVALALLVAESSPQSKGVMIRLIVNLLLGTRYIQ